LRVEGRALVLRLAYPLADVVGRPQTVEIALDGKPVRRITLDTADWRLVIVPVPGPLGRTVHVELRVGFTVVPAALGVNADTRRIGVLTQAVAWGAP
jgi:hypothetical protein